MSALTEREERMVRALARAHGRTYEQERLHWIEEEGTE